jgi:hypothetical protein
MKLKITVHPNPFSGELIVFIHAGFAVNTVARLINKNGTVIRIASCALKEGENKLVLKNLQRYAAGTYTMEITLLNSTLIERIHVVKK